MRPVQDLKLEVKRTFSCEKSVHTIGVRATRCTLKSVPLNLLGSSVAPLFSPFSKLTSHPDAPRVVYHFCLQNFSLPSQKAQQRRLACWTLVNLESDPVVLHSILFSDPQYQSYNLKQSIAWVPLLCQKIRKTDNVSNLLCFKKDKQLTRDVECCFLKQYQFLVWLYGKAISHSTKWMKF